MCGRATLTEPDLDRVADALEAQPTEPARALYRPRWNAAPGDRLCVAVLVDGLRRLAPARWGLPARGGVAGRVLVNLRAETASGPPPAAAPGVRASSGRCALPVDGFYEWSGAQGRRQPHWFHPAQGGLLRLAGVWRATPEGPAFAVLTVPAAGAVAAIHDRMPAILPPGQLGAWLAGAELSLAPAPSALLADRLVSARVNTVANDDPSCLEAPPPVPDRQLGLF